MKAVPLTCNEDGRSVKERDRGGVRIVFPGRRTRVALRFSTGLLFILLTSLSFMAGLPVKPLIRTDTGSIEDSVGSKGQNPPSPFPQSVEADSLPDLALPKTVLSSVDDVIGAGGVIQSSPENLTIYSPRVSLRLLGGSSPHDELLGSDGHIVSEWASWEVQTNSSGLWSPLPASSSNFTIFGTNKTGTFVQRIMQVSDGLHSGILRVVYTATPSGPLRWDLEFNPAATGNYRLVYVWSNITGPSTVSQSSYQFVTHYGADNYTMSWADASSFNDTVSLVSGRFQLSLDLGLVRAGSPLRVDPNVVSTSQSYFATGFTFQRKVFYDSKGGNYFVFYNDGTSLWYRSSRDGKNWSARQPSLTLGTNIELTVSNSGSQVVVAGSDPWCSSTSCSTAVRYMIGNITGPSIAFGTPYTAYTFNCSNVCSAGIEGIGSTISSTGNIVISFDYSLYHSSSGVCNGTLYGWYGSSPPRLVRIDSTIGCPIPHTAATDDLRSAVVPSDSQGGVRVVYQKLVPNGSSWTKTLRTMWLNGITNSSSEVLDANVPDTPEFSAVSTSDYRVQIVWKTLPSNSLSFAYRGPSDGKWTSYNNILSGTGYYPTLTADYSTSDVYVFAINPQNTSILMREKTSMGNWSDTTIASVVNGQLNPAYLGSNFASASAANSSLISLIWTTGPVNRLYNVTFASVPIRTVWSAYSDPSDPWNGEGIVPYGQYFSNLGESVSPFTGMLSVEQTDLSVPGRDLSMDLTRVYVEPFSFLAGPYLYENYPWSPMGDGWQLNFPWMNNVSRPAYIHLWNGEGYRIPSAFWNGVSGLFENHQGVSFRMTRNNTGVYLYNSQGDAYTFDPSHLNRLTTIMDPIGNQIQFAYNPNNQIMIATDTVQRLFQFCYSGGLLASINQTSSSCSTGGNTRGIVFKYSGPDLTQAYDPAGRPTSYTYNSFSGSPINPWILSRITYPTGWYTNYTFRPYLMGTQADTFRVSKQYVGTGLVSGPRVREFDYKYTNGAGDQTNNSTVTAYDGGTMAPVSYTSYVFSYAGTTWNITDGIHSFVRGEQQLFGVNGEVLREIVLVSPTQGYTNYYRYDLWGNLIYTRQMINPSLGSYHESFSAFYNDGLSPGFRSFQETFSQNGGNATDNPWMGSAGNWMVKNGVYNGTYVNGSVFNTFSWSNSSSSDLSIQARVDLARSVVPSALAGIFAHYPGSGQEKWSLYLQSTNGPTQFIQLYDDTASLVAQTMCSLTSILGWYTFNMTIHGTSATGWVQQDGHSACPTVTGSFSPSSSVVHATGFGLSTGGFSALFDNVTVATVSPFITTSGFSNSFFQTGAPNSNIHTALAGTAQLQNGTMSSPVESYDSYYSWEGLSQTKRLYTSQAGSQWLSSGTTYDAYGNPYQFTDARGNTTTYAFSAIYNHAYLTSQTEISVPGNNRITRSYSYNFTTGDRLSTIDPNGNNITYNYDVLSRPTRITYPTGDYTFYAYNDVTNYVDSIDENGEHTRQVFDGLGRLTTTETFLNGTPYANRTSILNWQNKDSSIIDGMGNVTYYHYDALGRLVNTTFADRTSILEIYNDTGSWIVTRTQNSDYSCRVNDRIGRLITVIETSDPHCHSQLLASLSYVTDYYYDELGNLDKIINAQSQPTVYTYDNLNRLVKTSYSDSTSESYSYDNNGNVVSRVDRKNVQTMYQYNSMNRLASVAYPTASVPGYNYTYDMNGNIIALQNQNTTIYYGYDGRNRVLSETYAVNPTPGNFNISTPSPSTIWLAQNSSASAAITLQANTGFMGIATFSASGLPAGTTPTFTQAAPYPTSSGWIAASTFKIYAGGIAPLGTYTVTVTATSGSYSHSLTFTVRVIAGSVSYKLSSILTGINGTIRLSLSVSTATSHSVIGTITRTALNSTTLATLYNDTISVSLSFTSSGASLFVVEMNTSPYWTAFICSLDITHANGNANCGLVRTPDIDHNGILNLVDYTFVSQKYGCYVGQTCYDPRADLGAFGVINIADVTIESTYYQQPVLPPGDFSISAYPTTLYVAQGFSGSSSLTLTSINGLAANITLSTSAGLSSSVSPSTVQLGSSGASSLSVYANPLFTQPATYNVIVNATTPGLSRTVTVLVAVSGLTCPTSFRANTPVGGSYTYTIGYCYRGEFLDTILYPDTTNLHYAYDNLGRVLNATRPGSSTYAIFGYNKNSQVTQATLGNGLTAAYSYDTVSRPSTITVTNSTGPPVLSLAYSYNLTGTVSSVVGSGNFQSVNEQYRYDPLQRLTNSTVTNDGATTTAWYQYDNLGNRLWQSVNGTKTSYTYNNANELTKACTAPSGSNCSASTTYSYDSDGNLLSQNVTTTGTTRWSYNWNPSGQLTKVNNDNGVQGQYAYDCSGRQVESVEASRTTFFSYLGTSVLFQNTQSGSMVEYVFANGAEIAKLFSSIAVNYYHTDALGSTWLVTDGNGRVVFSDGYQPYGQDNGRPSGTETFRFTGKPVSQTTGLYYEYQRWYDPTTGRFISRDPLAGFISDPQSLNGYVYVQNIPTVLTDPTGAGNEGPSCFGGLCEGPAPSVNLCASVPGWCNAEICAQDPFWCGGWDPGSVDVTDSGGGLCFCPADYTTDDTGGTSSSGTTTVTSSDTTPAIVDTNGAGEGPGGATPGQIGEQYEGSHLFNQIDRGYEPRYTEVQKGFRDPATGRIGRVDYFYNDGQTRLIDEVKGGYVSGEYSQNQALKYQRIANSQGASLRYFLCAGASTPFEDFLVVNEIWYTKTC